MLIAKHWESFAAGFAIMKAKRLRRTKVQTVVVQASEKVAMNVAVIAPRDLWHASQPPKDNPNSPGGGGVKIGITSAPWHLTAIGAILPRGGRRSRDDDREVLRRWPQTVARRATRNFLRQSVGIRMLVTRLPDNFDGQAWRITGIGGCAGQPERLAAGDSSDALVNEVE